ncbi:MAG: HupE/UreJ family protein [Verrucomicrobiales bacterium]|nr:HupE/UreJ family protein [Verrucomicrobiales bacterium]
MMRFCSVPTFIAIILFSCCGVTQAHPGHFHPEEEIDEFDERSYRDSVTHPFVSFDHLAVMLGVGALAFTMGIRPGSAIGVTFVGALGLGLESGMAISVPLVALSVILSGLLLLNQSRLAKVAPWCLVAAMGFWQGCSHGAGFDTLGLCLGTAAGLTPGALLAFALRSFQPRRMRLAVIR